MADMIDTSTEAVKALMDRVTAGPWTEHNAGKHPYVYVCGPDQLYYNGEVTDKPLVAYVTGVDAIGNRAFIAAARDLVPAMLSERDAMRDKLDEVVDVLVRVLDTSYGYSYSQHEDACEAARATIAKIKEKHND